MKVSKLRFIQPINFLNSDKSVLLRFHWLNSFRFVMFSIIGKIITKMKIKSDKPFKHQFIFVTYLNY